MDQEIKNQLTQYLQQEQALLNQYRQIKTRRDSAGKDLSNAIISEGAAAVASDFFESAFAGRLGRKVTKSILAQKQQEQYLVQLRNMETSHINLVTRITDFLSSISIQKRNLNKPNSNTLISKVVRAQEFARIDTRIKRTILAIMSIMNNQLIHNREISLEHTPQAIVFQPGKPFTASMKIKDILRQATGYIKIIDPYVSDATLEFLLDIPPNLSIKLLTAQTGGTNKERRFQRACKLFQEERPKYEIRKCDRKLIHDRFILTHTNGWTIGSSLTSIGKKLSMIQEISSKMKREIEREFNKIWATSTPI